MRIHWIALTLITVFLVDVHADWPRWRGPNMNNISVENGQLDPWPANGPPLLWKTNVGTGFSSVSVWGGALYTLGNQLNTDTVSCLDARTGALRWAHSYPASLDPLLYEGGPGATPNVHEGRVYSLGKAGDLYCLNATNGAVIWSKHLIPDFGLRVAEWGFAGSPVIHDEKVLLNAGGQGMALHKDTGELLWLTDTNRAGYSTPVVTEVAGQAAVLVFCRREVAAVSLANGSPIWSTGWTTLYDQNCTDPIVHRGGFLVSSWTHAGVMLSFNQNQLGTNWQNPDLAFPLSPGVKLDHFLYTFQGRTDNGNVITCVDLDTGQTRWAVNGYPIGSVICVGGKLLFLSGNGALILVEANPEAFRSLANSYVLSGRCWTMPAFSEGILYVRNATGELVALQMAWTPADSAPNLDVALQDNLARISWPITTEPFTLEFRPLDPTEVPWTPVSQPPVTSGNRKAVTVPPTLPGAIYRLRGE